MANPIRTFPGTATGTISIRNGDIVVEAEDGTEDPIRVAAGGRLQFQTDVGSNLKWWSILWLKDTPFDDASGWAGGHRGSPHGKKLGNQSNGGGQSEKSYKYGIVASDGTKMYFRDPEVVVGPPAGP